MRSLLAGLLVLGVGLAAAAEDTNLPGRLVVQANDTEPTCSTAVSAGELCVEGDAEVLTNLEVDGTATLAGATTITGALACGSTLTVAGTTTLSSPLHMDGNYMYHVRSLFTDKTTDYTIESDDCGATIVTDDDNRVFTLPAVAPENQGCHVVFVNTAADASAKVSISPNANDAIVGTCCGPGPGNVPQCTAFDEVDDKDVINTKTTQHRGDYIRLISDGTLGWYSISCEGIWESES